MTRGLLGILAAVAVAAAVVVGVQRTGSGDGQRVWVDLADAAGLREGSQVKVGGVPVGTVDELEVTARDTARARLKLDAGQPAVGEDAQAWIRTANLLGEKYVDLHVGDRRHPMRGGGTIPASRTRVPVELDQVVDVLTPETRARLALLLREAGLGLAGRGDDLGATIAALPPSLDDATALLDEITADNRRLRALLDHAGAVAASVAPAGDDLADLVRDAAAALRIAGARRTEIEGTLAQAPGTLTQLRRTLVRLEAASGSLRPAAAGLRRTAVPLTQTLRALPGFAADARPTLRDLDAVSPDLTRLARELEPTVRRLRPTAQQLAGLGRDTDRLSGSLDRAAPDLLGTIQGWTSSIQLRDGLSHLFQLTAVVSPAMLSALTKYVVGPTATATPPTPRRRAPGTAEGPARPVTDPVRKVIDGTGQQPADVRKLVKPIVDRAPGLLDLLLKP